MSNEKLEQIIKVWQEKITNYELELAITSSTEKKFELSKQIGQCKEEISKIQNKQLNRFQSIIEVYTKDILEIIIKDYEKQLNKSVIETMKIKDVPYTDEIINLKANKDNKEIINLGEVCFKQYLEIQYIEHNKLTQKDFYLIAQFLSVAIFNNNFEACQYKSFIYPVHQYLSKDIKNCQNSRKERIINNLMYWLVSNEEVYETSRHFAAFQLGMCQVSKAKEILFKLLENPQEAYPVRQYCAMAIGMLRERDMIERLIELYHNEMDLKIKSYLIHVIMFISNSQI